MGREAAVYVKRLLSRHRMGTRHRVLGARIGWFIGNARIRIKAAIDYLSVVKGSEPVQIGLHPVRQRVVGGIHAREQSIAAVRRTLFDIENTAHRWFEIARHVAVPAFAIRPRAVLVGIDFHQCRLARLVRRGRMDVQFPEQPTEGQVLLRRDVLITEKDDDILGQRPMDFVDRPVGQRFCEIDAVDFRANDRRELVDADRLVGSRSIGRVPIAGAFLAAERTHGKPPGMMLLSVIVARTRPGANRPSTLPRRASRGRTAARYNRSPSA